MMIWSRLGILYPVLWGIIALLFYALMQFAGLAGWIGYRFTAVVILLLVSFANFVAAGAEEDSGHISSLFFIPMPLWSLIGLGIAVGVGAGWIAVG